MREKAKSIIKHPLISGSILVSGGSLFANFLSFLFNIFISRNLSVNDYGTVASLIAIINLFGISAGAINPTIISFTGPSFLEKKYSYIRGVYLRIAKPFLAIGAIILLVFLVFNEQIALFLNISEGKSLIIVAAFIIFISFASVLNLALIQSKLSFTLFSFLNILAAGLKLILGAVFVLMGFSSFGVMIGILISYMLPYLFGFNYLRFLFNGGVSDVKVDFGDIVRYAAPSGVALLSLTAITSTDLLLVKHLFDPQTAGVYAGLSLIGKVIFFFTAPIGIVMFPLMARKHDNNEHHGKIMPASLFLVGMASFGITLFYFLFPEFIINMFLKNTLYLSATPYLGLFGIFISIYSLCSIMMYYFLSIKKTWIYKPILLAALFQGVAIYLFHSTFYDVIFISIFSVTLLFIFLISYYRFGKRD